MNAMKTELSPTTEAVLDAFESSKFADQSALAAALREIVNQLKFYGITEYNILAIAAELEAQP